MTLKQTFSGETSFMSDKELLLKITPDRQLILGDVFTETEAAKRFSDLLLEFWRMNNSAWQPIETAPRDKKTLILVYRPLAHLSNDPIITIKETTQSPHDCFSNTIPDGYRKEQHFNTGAAFATHWMPLPIHPPKEG